MRLIHFSDLHLDETYNRIADYTALLGVILDEVIAFAPDCVLFGGDAYHTHTPKQENKAIFHAYIMAMAKVCPVFLVVGNHDRTRRQNAKDALYEFTSLGVENVYVFHEMGRVSMGSYTVTGIPWQYSKEYTIPPLGDGFNIALVHASFLGANMGGSSVTVLGHDFIIAPEDVAGFDYVAAGHIHTPQQIGNIIYPGSVGIHNWGEFKDGAHYYILYDDGVVKWVPFRDRIRFSFDIEDEPDTIYPEAMYRIVVPHDYKDMASLLRHYDEVFDLSIIREHDPVVRVRMPTFVDASLPDKELRLRQLKTYFEAIEEEFSPDLVELFEAAYEAH